MRAHADPYPHPAASSAFAGTGSHPKSSPGRSAGTCGSACLTGTVEELLGERGIQVDHVTIYRWVQRFAPEFAQAARARQHRSHDGRHRHRTQRLQRVRLRIAVLRAVLGDR
jgi:hypothetical protein